MSVEPPLSDDELAAVAEELKSEHGLFTRRDVIAAAAATGSVGVLAKLGIDTTEAAHGTGNIGEPGNPLDTAYVTSISGDGDTVDLAPNISTSDATFSNSVTWPDGSTTTTSPGGGVTDEIKLIDSGNVNTYNPTAQGLRDAIAAATTNSVIELPPMDVSLGTTGESLPNKCSLKGSGKRTTIIRCDDGVGTLLSAGDDCVFEDITFIRDTTGSNDTGILALSAANVWMNRCEIQKFWRNVDLNGAGQVWITNSFLSNTFTGTGGGASVNARTDAGSCEDIHIKNNLFGGCSTPAVVIEANDVSTCGNHFEGNEHHYYRQTFGAACKFNDNHITINGTAPSNNLISVTGGYCEIQENHIKSDLATGGYGIEYAGDVGARISDNYVENQGYAGINVNANDCTVTGNVCKNNDQNGTGAAYAAGIYLNGVTDCSVGDNRCYDDQTTKTQDYGISSNGGDFNSVTGNTVRGNATSGLNGLGTGSVQAGNVT